ncbi:MAG: hypothetical protein JSU00_26310 [Acidobacteria bacterium]|nr:hypothetical protein [Acidobacteriota bacterium]
MRSSVRAEGRRIGVRAAVKGFRLALRLGEVGALATDEEFGRRAEGRRIGVRAAVKGFRLAPRLGEVCAIATDEEFCRRVEGRWIGVRAAVVGAKPTMPQFGFVEDGLRERCRSTRDSNIEEMEDLWQEAKQSL